MINTKRKTNAWGWLHIRPTGFPRLVILRDIVASQKTPIKERLSIWVLRSQKQVRQRQEGQGRDQVQGPSAGGGEGNLLLKENKFFRVLRVSDLWQKCSSYSLALFKGFYYWCS